MLELDKNPYVGEIAKNIDSFITILMETCEFSTDGTTNFGAVDFALNNVSKLPYYPVTVKNAIEQAMLEAHEYSVYSITASFVKIYPKLIEEIAPLHGTIELPEEHNNDICYQFSTLCTHMIPHVKTDKTEIITEYPQNKMTVSCPIGLPYGGIARMIILYVNTIAVKYRTRHVQLGRSIKNFVESLGYSTSYIEGGTNELVIMQLEKLFYTSYFNEYSVKTKTADGQIIEQQNARFHLFDAKESWVNIIDQLSTNTSASVYLSSAYYEAIIKHPVPLSYPAIIKMKKSPLALDLYSFITYRANSNRAVAAKYSELKKQFGYDAPDWRFKVKLQLAYKYIEKEWPECQVIFNKNAIIIPRMNTHINQLQK